jgi:hypothetical protein
MRVLACLAFLGLSVQGALAVPIPEPPPQPERPRHVDLTGTTWEGPDGSLGEIRFTFEPNGRLSYTYKKSGQTLVAAWQQHGGLVTFQINNNYRHFRGTIDADAIAGDSWNRAGEKWNTSMRRMPAGK